MSLLRNVADGDVLAEHGPLQGVARLQHQGVRTLYTPAAFTPQPNIQTKMSVNRCFIVIT